MNQLYSSTGEYLTRVLIVMRQVSTLGKELWVDRLQLWRPSKRSVATPALEQKEATSHEEHFSTLHTKSYGTRPLQLD